MSHLQPIVHPSLLRQLDFGAGNGDILEPMSGVIGIGSGGIYAQTAATALIDIEGLTAEDIARRSMKVSRPALHGRSR